MRQIKHWQDGANAVLGAWLLLSPWAVGYAAQEAASANAVIVGLALVAAALGAMWVPRAWEEWTEVVLGLWLVASPWVLGFAGERGAMLTALCTGIVVAALALWTVATDKDYQLWHRGSTAH